MADGKERVLMGHMTNLPSLSSNTVRIFTSSTFTDMATERNMLMEDVYPKLREFCRSSYGLQFQVVDMRWGIRDDAADDHKTSSLCMQEIRACQNESVGPNFVTFLGQRHGYRPCPTIIESAEFEQLCAALRDAQDDNSLLQAWYQQDENNIPPQHVLQPITSSIPHFLSEDEADRREGRVQWANVMNQLQHSLRKASHLCHQSGVLDEKEKHKYFMSVTEGEVEMGIFQAPGDPNDHCICFVRIIDDLVDHLTDSLTSRYLDLKQPARDDNDRDCLDEEAQTQLATLRDQRVGKILNKDNVHKSVVKWDKEEGISQFSHRSYLEEFSQQFYKAVASMVARGIQAQRELRRDSLYLEVLQHARLAAERGQQFQGRKELLSDVAKKLTTSRSLLVIHGQSGCGKTSVMAKTAELAREWLDAPDAVVILRFLGTSPSSSSLPQLMASITSQISSVYNLPLKDPTQEVNDLVQEFIDVMQAATEKRPLVILLDSLDQLSGDYYAHKLGWLPCQVPDNVYLVVSTLPQQHGILNRLESKLPDERFLEVPILGEQLSSQLLNDWLLKSNRTLTSPQRTVVTNAFQKCSLPLYVKLVFEEVVVWRSYHASDRIYLRHTVRDIINELFVRLEKNHGETLVRHAMGYITASRGGLSEPELEDLLSLDDEVLSDVFQYHIPPVRRMPPVLWLRLRSDISNYLVTREADDIPVLYWYHRQFIEAAKDRYLNNEQFTQYLHENLANYFLGVWHGKKKSFLYTDNQVKKLGITSNQGKADRKVAPQPMYFHRDESSGAVLFNKRKLNNLPYHLAKCNEIITLKTECLFSYEWLKSKIEATSMQAMLHDLDLLQSDAECSLLRNALNLARSTLPHDPSTIASEIVGRLLPHAIVFNKYIFQLVSQCIDQGYTCNSLVPHIQCYPAPGGAQKFALENPDLAFHEKLMTLNADGSALYTVTRKNELLLWDLKNGEVERAIPIKLEKPKYKLDAMGYSTDRKQVVFGAAFHDDVNQVVVIDIVRGEIVHNTKLEKVYFSVGFRDYYHLALSGNKLFVHVTGKDIDCFDIVSGNLLHNFPVMSSLMYVSQGNFMLAHTKNTKELLLYNLENYTQLSTQQLPGAPIQILASRISSSTYYIIYKDSPMISKLNIENTKKSSKLHLNLMIDLNMFSCSIMQQITLTNDESLMLLTTKEHFVVWNMQRNKVLNQFTIPDHVRPDSRVLGFCGEITTDKKTLVAAFEDYVLVWSLAYGRLHRTIRATPSLRIMQLLVTSDSCMAITNSERNNVLKVWDLENMGEEVHFPLALSCAARHITTTTTAPSPLFATRSYDAKETRVVNAQDGQIISSPSKEYEVYIPEITDDGEYVVLREHIAMNAIKVWDSQDGQLVATIPVRSLYLRGHKASPQSSYLVTHCEASPTEDVHLTLWELASGKKLGDLSVDKGGFNYIFFTKSESYIVTMQQFPVLEHGRNCTLQVYSVRQRRLLWQMSGLLRETLYVLDGEKERVLAVQCGQQNDQDRLVCWDITTKKQIYSIESVPHRRLALSGDTSRGVDTNLQVYDLVNGSLLCRFPHEGKPLMNQAYQSWPRMSGDGHHVAWVKQDAGEVLLGRVADGTVIGRCFVHATPTALQCCSDGYLIVGCDDGRLILLSIIDPDDNNHTIDRRLKHIHNQVNSNMTDLYPAARMFSKQSRAMKRSACCSIS